MMLYVKRMERCTYGRAASIFGLLLDGAVWASGPAGQRATIVHLSGMIAEIACAEREVALGKMPEQPLVPATQPSVAGPDRAPVASTRSECTRP